jgi:HPt (histidine-containing phosphotransfer) domain-containing protein
MGRHYDLTYLHDVFHGNESMVQQIVELFLEQAPAFGQSMTQCVREGKWKELHPIAHKLKSSVNMLGMTGLAPILLEIERTSKLSRDPSTLPALVFELNMQLELVLLTLSHDLAEVNRLSQQGNQGLRRA